MKLWFVLLGVLIVLLWWFVNGLLMLLLPAKFSGFVWWPVSCWYVDNRNREAMSLRTTRLLGGIFALASGCLLLGVVVPAIIGLIVQYLRS